MYLKRWILGCAIEQVHEEEEEYDGREQNRGEGERCGEQKDGVVIDNKEGTDEFGSE